VERDLELERQGCDPTGGRERWERRLVSLMACELDGL
jgi:hypothetical protein